MSFEEFYKITFEKVYRYFYYKSVEKAFIEDLTHDCFLRFYTKYQEKLKDQTESQKIIFGICHNVYKEWVRQRMYEKYQPDFEKHATEESIVDNFEDFVDEEYEKKLDLQKQALKEALSQLNEKVRAVIELRFMQCLSRKEVAEKLNMNEKDVHTYQKRGIKYLNKILNP
jgi:RNA polymerase sigma-70 factor (ECF subfamily)